MDKCVINFSKNLKDLIGDRKINAVAAEIGIKHQTLSRYLSCERMVKLDNLVKIADYFGEDIDVLIGRRDY